MVKSGDFRADLFYRINAFPIRLPALRERMADLRLLVEHLLARVSTQRRLRLPERAIDCSRGYAFPGKVKELRNILERASLLSDGDVIELEHLSQECLGKDVDPDPTSNEWSDHILPLHVIEQEYLRRLLERHPQDRDHLAARLGISERTFFRKIRGLSRNHESSRARLRRTRRR